MSDILDYTGAMRLAEDLGEPVGFEEFSDEVDALAESEPEL